VVVNITLTLKIWNCQYGSPPPPYPPPIGLGWGLYKGVKYLCESFLKKNFGVCFFQKIDPMLGLGWFSQKKFLKNLEVII
jgi:hypothetical protein